MNKLTHFDLRGNAHMVDIAVKSETDRIARARGRISMGRSTLALIASGKAKKGDVLGIARIAAIQGSKRTPELIPLAHPLSLTSISVDFWLDRTHPAVECEVTAATRGRTGVEMEALTAVTIGLLTIYDMCKAVDRGMSVENVRLLEKRGGNSGVWKRALKRRGRGQA